ncbi:MAG: SDR family oxidoreductase [Cytophagaceae bacterium]
MTDKKIVLITGASSGLGFTIANYLHGKGYTVYGTSRKITSEGKSFNTIPMDVCDPVSIQNCVSQIMQNEGKIDVLINNAGIGIAGPLEHFSMEDVGKVFDTNVFGVLKVCKAVLPHMRKAGAGKIINISSIGSELGLPYRAAYSASKAAMDRLSEAMRLEVKKYGIQICTVQPGGVNTDINTNRILTEVPENSPYKSSFERTYSIINESVRKGLDPEVFGPFIEKLINAKKIKRNYRVGKATEKLSVFLKKILPQSVFDNIISKHYKI